MAVIDPYYCAPYHVNLQINTENGTTYDGNNNRIFYTKDALVTLHKRRVLYDDEEKPIVTLYNKNMTLHGRCEVFRGKSSDSSQLLFTVKRSSMCSTTRFDVFLSKNTSESKCDFRVIISEGKSSCAVYVGESPTIVATMFNNGGFNVVVNPYVDHAFIVALLMIINQKTDGELTKNSVNGIGQSLGAMASFVTGLN